MSYAEGWYADKVKEQAADIERHMREKVELAGLVAKERARIERLKAALSRYGDHTYECELKNGGGCSCGYEAALAGKEET